MILKKLSIHPAAPMDRDTGAGSLGVEAIEFFVEFWMENSDQQMVIEKTGVVDSSDARGMSELVQSFATSGREGLSRCEQFMLNRSLARAERFTPYGAYPHTVAAWLRHMADLVEMMPRELQEMAEREAVP